MIYIEEDAPQDGSHSFGGGYWGDLHRIRYINAKSYEQAEERAEEVADEEVSETGGFLISYEVTQLK